MTRRGAVVAVGALAAAVLLVWALAARRGADARWMRLLLRDGALVRQEQEDDGGRWHRISVGWNRWRVGREYRSFLRDYPEHARARVAYGCFLAEHHREDDAAQQWERAVQADPGMAVAWNNLGEQHAHSGRVIEGLRMMDKARTLEPRRAVFHYNWALVCSTYRREAQQLYGWDADEIFRQSLAAFQRARDLAPADYEIASAYAQTYYLIPRADWEGARAAWSYCLPLTSNEVQRERVCGYLARICMRLGRSEEARQWLAQMIEPEIRPLRTALEKKLNDTPPASPGS